MHLVAKCKLVPFNLGPGCIAGISSPYSFDQERRGEFKAQCGVRASLARYQLELSLTQAYRCPYGGILPRR
jgi:hypothetical protein